MNDCCADRSILVLPFAYRECPVTFKLMTSQVVQKARPLSGHIWPVRSQRVKATVYKTAFPSRVSVSLPRQYAKILVAFFKAPAEKPKQIFRSRQEEHFDTLQPLKKLDASSVT